MREGYNGLFSGNVFCRQVQMLLALEVSEAIRKNVFIEAGYNVV